MLALILTHNTHFTHHVFIPGVPQINSQGAELATENRFQIATDVRFSFRWEACFLFTLIDSLKQSLDSPDLLCTGQHVCSVYNMADWS